MLVVAYEPVRYWNWKLPHPRMLIKLFITSTTINQKICEKTAEQIRIYTVEV